MSEAGSLLAVAPVIPVVVLEDADTAVPVARALVNGGGRVIELNLRTAAAPEAIERIADEVPEILVGAGSFVHPDQANQAAAAGARFLVSPGSTPALLAALADTGLPHLPGCATVSEVMALKERGYTELKLFPAEASGGVGFLRSLHGPLPGVRFCPTGGVTAENAADYLALANVGCVGGSWLTPADAVRDRDWTRIETLARATAELRGD